MPFFLISFGQGHEHSFTDEIKFDKDTLGVIYESDEKRARVIASQCFNNVYSTTYPEDHFPADKAKEYFPKGYQPVNFNIEEDEYISADEELLSLHGAMPLYLKPKMEPRDDLEHGDGHGDQNTKH